MYAKVLYATAQMTSIVPPILSRHQAIRMPKTEVMINPAITQSSHVLGPGSLIP